MTLRGHGNVARIPKCCGIQVRMMRHPVNQFVNQLVHWFACVANGNHQILGVGSQDKNKKEAHTMLRIICWWCFGLRILKKFSLRKNEFEPKWIIRYLFNLLFWLCLFRTCSFRTQLFTRRGDVCMWVAVTSGAPVREELSLALDLKMEVGNCAPAQWIHWAHRTLVF